MMDTRAGFSLVEVVFAMMILTVGVLAMGASTGFILNQVRAADLRTDRMVATRHMTEVVRSAPWTDLEAACQNMSYAVGPGCDGDNVTPGRGCYTYTCSVERSGNNLATVKLISVGPAVMGGRVRQSVTDSMELKLARP